MTTMRLVPAMFALAFATPACPKDPVPPPPSPVDAAAPDAAGGVTCATYCAHLRVACPDDAKTTPGGATCEQVCTNYQTSGYAARDFTCEMHASTCTTVHACKQ